MLAGFAFGIASLRWLAMLNVVVVYVTAGEMSRKATNPLGFDDVRGSGGDRADCCRARSMAA